MKAFTLSAFGETSSITEVETPRPGLGEVLVKVHAASVNGFDTGVASGRLEGMMEHRFPVVVGKDFAGVVAELGEGVTDYSVGDRVFGVVTKDFLGDGSFAEYVTVATAVGLAHLPEEIGFTEGAALGLAGTAAVMAFDAADVREGDTVLVVGATGGVGQQGVQLAVNAGASVIATAHTDAEREVVTKLGAGDIVDYTGDVAAQVREIVPEGVDVVLHFAGAPGPVVAAAKPDAAFASTVLRGPDDVPSETLRVTSVYAHPAPETLNRLGRNQAEGRTSVTVQEAFALDDIDAAFAKFAEGSLGKIVISVA